MLGQKKRNCESLTNLLKPSPILGEGNMEEVRENINDATFS
jgi:hypothetical protein